MKENKKIHFSVTEDLSGLRLDKALSKLDEIKSRTQAEYLIEKNCVTVNLKPVKAAYKMNLGDKVTVTIPDPEVTQLSPLQLKLDILFEDEMVIVINKPAGLVVHPAAGHSQDTLVNALMAYTKNLSMRFGENRPGIVHRLDRDTSGVLVVAKTDLAHETLAKQFRDKTTHRVYYALVYGSPKMKSGKISTYLARHPTHRKKFASLPKEKEQKGKWSVTNYSLVQSTPFGISLLKLILETGRTHQIRVHLSEMGCPIVGDSLYGFDKKIKNLSADIALEISKLNRFALHAAELGFTSPKTHEKILFKVDWPEEMFPLLKKLGLK